MKLVSPLVAACLFSCLVLVLVPDTPALTRTLESFPIGCGDFLAEIRKKPAHLSYIGCSYLPDRQGKPLRAIYHVSGRFAAITEGYFIKSIGLNRLQRSCCQWDSAARQFKDAKGREFSITMVSEPTTVTSRTAWRGISTFEVVVETFTEDF
ncbi:DUF4952 domain-containing protein [Bradyrhizobium sp.]